CEQQRQQHLIRRLKDPKATFSKRFQYLLFGLPGFLLLLALLFTANGKGMLSLWTSLFYSEATSRMVQQGVTKFDLALVNLPAIQTGAWLALVFSGLAALFVWAYVNRRAGAILLLGMILIPVIDGIRFNSRFVGTFDQDRIWSPNPVTDFFARQDGNYRVMNLSGVIQEDLLPYHGVAMVTGYHGNQLRWYDELLGGPGARNQTNPRLLNLAGARYLLLPANRQLPPGYLGDEPATLAANLSNVQIIQNDNALPRVFLADSFRIYADRKEVYPEVLNGSEDLRQIVYLEREPDIQISFDTTGAAGDSTWIIDYAIDSVLIGLDCSRNHLLVLTDNYYDSWHAYVDGQPAELLRAYGTFRAVAVPAGTTEVLFKYDSQRYRTGRTVTGLTVLYLLIVIGYYGLRSTIKRRTSKGQP
ncbi:MAG: hypothetical protein AB1744_12055, partial [Candidatus Zixiibacteriota bacterium]